MTRPLFLVFLVMEALDLALYAQAPTFESGPMGAVPPPVVVVAKVTAVVLVVGLASLLAHLWPKWWGASLVLAVGIAIAAFGAGTAAATLSIVNAAETPRPAERTPEAVPVRAQTIPARRTPVLPSAGLSRPPAARVPTGGGGLASWYRASGMVAAAGPALRVGHWRGRWVTVCAGTCVRVTLSDWCQCYAGTRRERLLDLSDDAFVRLAPLAAGLVRVQVVSLRLPATDR